MSNLLSLQSIIKEQSPVRSIIKTPITETYLNSSVSILENTNNNIQEITKDLYYGVLEATSRHEENKAFGEYFKKYKQIISTYQRDMNELVSRFAINLDTFADANSGIVEKANGISVTGDPMIKIYKYTNLDNNKIPNINVYKAFKKEFKFLGQMMQDLGTTITDDDVKAKVLATVCNNLADDIQDGWLEKCMEKISDSEDCSKDNFANIIYSKFISGELEEIAIGVGDIQQSRLAILNTSTFINNIRLSAKEFNEGLDRVAAEIGAMFFRNQDKVMPIKTDEDGVEDRDYHMTDYSFNQFDQFMATKCTQITELCNLYLIAMGIKCDAIYKYLQQCKDIIEAALSGVDSTPNTEIDEPGEEDIDNTDDDTEVDDEPDQDPDITNGDDIEKPDMDADFNDDNSIKDKEPVNDSEDQEKADEAEKEFEEACYLFEATCFSLNRSINENYIHEYFNTLITEADNLDSLKKAADGAQANKMKSFVNQIFKLFDKFKQVFISSIKTRIEKIQNNKKFIEDVDIPKGWTQDAFDCKALLELKAADFKYPDTNLSDEDTYIKANWAKYIGDGNSIKDKFIAKLQTKDKPYDNSSRQDGFAFLAKFESEMNELQGQINMIKNAQTKAESIAKQVSAAASKNESVTSLEEAMVMYFNEADNMDTDDKKDDKPDNNNTQTNNNDKGDDKKPDQDKKSDDNAKKAVNLYFSVNVKVLAAKMSMMQMAAKSHCNFLEKLYSMSGKEESK